MVKTKASKNKIHVLGKKTTNSCTFNSRFSIAFNKPIRNTLIARNSNKYQVTKVSKTNQKE